VVRIGNNLDFWEASWNDSAYLEVLGDPLTAFGPMATLLLALGLAAKEPGQVGLAVEAAIAALGDGRLAGQVLGGTMAGLLPSGLIKAARWAKSLATVAAASDRHAAEVAIAIQAAFRGQSDQGPRDEGKLVELLHELLIARGARITDPEAWAYLSAGRHRKKLADVAPA
jgi:hypothetical protein